MSKKSRIAHIVNSVVELRGYTINTGFDHLLSKIHYNPRLIQLPFLFRYIRDSPASVVDIGCSESMAPVQLSMMGYDVTGIDIRDYKYTHEHFTFIKDDFVEHGFSKKFDIAVNISAIEHFGLQTYGTIKADPAADLKAMRKIHAMLKPGGQLIFTSPYGLHEIVGTFERVYDEEDLKKLFRGFRILNKEYYKVVKYRQIERINQEQASRMKHMNDTYAVVLVNAQKTKL